MESKKEIRKRVLAKREALTPAERYRSAVLVTDRILCHEWFYNAEYILLFASYGSEISTDELLQESLKMGKKVFMPKVEGDTMEFYRILSKDDLVAGYKGILEPDGTGTSEKFVYGCTDTKFDDTETNELEPRPVNNADAVLMIMPGAAFDPMRNRIGYGKGFYDKYLADKPQLHTIAIGFDCQMVDCIGEEETDIKPMQVICL